MRKYLAAFLPPVVLAAGLPALPYPDDPPEPEPGSAGIRVSDLVERAEVRLLLVDVVVTDRQGNLVTDLAREDFQLLIDGDPARIDTFELRDFRRDAELVRGREEDGAAPEPVPVRRENRVVLFFDVFNSGTAGLRRMWTRAREFLAGDVPAFDRVMIIVYSDRLRVVQEFSTDPEEWRKNLADLEGGLINRDSYVERESSRMESIADLCSQGPCAKKGDRLFSACDGAWGLAQGYTQEEIFRALKTLRALKGTIFALGGMPGRKSVVYFSEGVRRTPGRQYADAAGCIDCACYSGGDVYVEESRLDHEMDDIFKSANAANIVFHTIDVRSTDRSITSGRRRGMKRQQIPGSSFPRELFSTTRRGSGTEDFLINFSFHTGGLRGVATAKPKKNFQRLEDRIGTYYVLGHHLERPEPDGLGHNLIVRVDRRGLDLRYRRTFRDFDWREREERSLRGALAVPEVYSEPSLAARVVSFPGREKENSVFLEVGIRMSDLTWIPTPVGELGEIEVAGAVRGLKGSVQHQFRHRLELKKGDWEGESDRRLCYLEETGLAPGKYELVAAIHDIGGQGIGARRVEFEVPEGGGDAYRLTGPVLAKFSRNDLVAGARPPYARVRGFREEQGDTVLSPVLDGELETGDVLLAYLRVTPPAGRAVGTTRTGWVTILRGGEVVARHRPARVGTGKAAPGEPVDYAVSIPLGDLDPGEYDLRAVMTDRTAGDRLTTEVRFRVR